MLSRLSRFASYLLQPKVQLKNIESIEILSWMEDLKSHRVKDYIKAENRYTSFRLLRTRRFQKKIQKFLKELSIAQVNNHSGTNYEECFGSYIYYEKRSKDALPCIYRKHLKSDDENLVLDQNDIIKETGYVQVNEIKPSPSGMYLAAMIRTNDSSEIGDCHIYKLMTTGPVFLEKLPCVTRAEWFNDDKNLMIGMSSVGAIHQIKRFCLEDRCIYHLMTEYDPRFTFDLLKSRDNQYIIAHSNTKNCTEVHFLDANNSTGSFQCLVKREETIECFVDHWDDHFYAIKNTQNNFDYVIAKIQSGEASDWHEIYSTKNRRRCTILDMEIFSNSLLVHELNNLIPQLTYISLDGKHEIKSFKTAEHPAIMESFSNQDPECQTVRYTITSPIDPLKLIEYDRSKNSSRVISSMLPNWHPSDFQCTILESKSKDGVNIPTTIYYNKNIKDLGKSPTFITVYGSYGESVDLRFSPEMAFLLQNGWILAFPHVRGGGEFGRKWYKRATKQNKWNTFQDLVASIKHLHRIGFSNPSKTAVFGMSAGGLAAAVLCNEAADLFKAAVLKVPFVDVLNSMLNQGLNLTSQEYEEWGNPRESKEDFSVIESYCPFQNLKASKNFPSVYLMSYLDDERVPAWTSLKWMAKRRHLDLQSAAFIDKLILCRIYESGGHFGHAKIPRECQISEMIAFLYLSLGLEMKMERI